MERAVPPAFGNASDEPKKSLCARGRRLLPGLMAPAGGELLFQVLLKRWVGHNRPPTGLCARLPLAGTCRNPCVPPISPPLLMMIFLLITNFNPLEVMLENCVISQP